MAGSQPNFSCPLYSPPTNLRVKYYTFENKILFFHWQPIRWVNKKRCCHLLKSLSRACCIIPKVYGLYALYGEIIAQVMQIWFFCDPSNEIMKKSSFGNKYTIEKKKKRYQCVAFEEWLSILDDFEGRKREKIEFLCFLVKGINIWSRSITLKMKCWAIRTLCPRHTKKRACCAGIFFGEKNYYSGYSIARAL